MIPFIVAHRIWNGPAIALRAIASSSVCPRPAMVRLIVAVPCTAVGGPSPPAPCAGGLSLCSTDSTSILEAPAMPVIAHSTSVAAYTVPLVMPKNPASVKSETSITLSKMRPVAWISFHRTRGPNGGIHRSAFRRNSIDSRPSGNRPGRNDSCMVPSESSGRNTSGPNVPSLVRRKTPSNASGNKRESPIRTEAKRIVEILLGSSRAPPGSVRTI